MIVRSLCRFTPIHWLMPLIAPSEASRQQCHEKTCVCHHSSDFSPSPVCNAWAFIMRKSCFNGLVELFLLWYFLNESLARGLCSFWGKKLAVPRCSSSAVAKVLHDLEFWGSDAELEAVESEQTLSTSLVLSKPCAAYSQRSLHIGSCVQVCKPAMGFLLTCICLCLLTLSLIRHLGLPNIHIQFMW